MDQRIEKVLNYLEDNIGQTARLEQLAEIACLSPSQFHRLFKRETGDTPFKFLEKLKINMAYQRILGQNATIQDLALELGYNDYETLTRAFKKYFYLAPDDLKSIALEIRSHFEQEQPLELVFITAEEDTTEQEITAKLNKMLKKKGLSIHDLPASWGYRVHRVGDSQEKGVSMKKKFEIVKDQKIWSSLINQNKSE